MLYAYYVRTLRRVPTSTKEGGRRRERQEEDEPEWMDGGKRMTKGTGTGKGTSRSHP